VQYITTRAPIFSHWPDAKRVFLPNGAVPKVGDVFVQADLARTLRSIVSTEKRNARRGRHAALMAARDYFYKGALGKRIGDYMQAHGGLLAAGDLAAGMPRSACQRRANIAVMKFYKRVSGPRADDDRSAEFARGLRPEEDGSGTRLSTFTVTEALKLGFADRDRFYGDPDFVKIPRHSYCRKTMPGCADL